MSNYKNLKFSNTMEGFKAWSKEFPPMDKEAVKATAYKKHEDYYLELQLVEGFLGADKFISANIRQYDQEDKDFSYPGLEVKNELLETVFSSKLNSFKTKHNAPFYK